MYIVTSIETSRTKHRTVRMAQKEANDRLNANHSGVAITRELPKGSYFRTANVAIIRETAFTPHDPLCDSMRQGFADGSSDKLPCNCR